MKLLAFLSLFLLSCSTLERVFVEEDLLKRPPAKRCSECHQKIYREWLKSRHHLAYTSKDFIRTTENYSKLKCLSCHAPHQVEPGKRPALRKVFLKDGVNCAGCHYRGEDLKGFMYGPYKVFSPPHPSKRDKNFTSSLYCSSCHQRTYKEWKEAKVSKSCQSCHMPYLGKDDLIQKFPFDLFHLAKERHSHSFPSLKAKEEDLKITLEGNRLKIVNVGIPHNLPTADHGSPKYYLIVEGKGFIIKRLFTPKLRVLKYKEPLYLEVPSTEELKVSLYRRLSWSKRRELVLSKVLRASPSSVSYQR